MIKKRTNYNDIYNYKNSRHFYNAVLETRRFEEEQQKDIVIFAGACQSYFEALISAGADFASSPYRILIDYMDPLLIARKIATTHEYKYITINEIRRELKDGSKAIGGIGAYGKMKYV